MTTGTTETTENPERYVTRPAVITPRRNGYVHRPILVVHSETGYTEDGYAVRNLHIFAAAMESHVWVTLDPAWLLDHLTARFGEHPDWTYQLIESSDGQISKSRLVRFGFRAESKRNAALHLCWHPYEMVPNPTSFIDSSPEGLMRFAIDLRAWVQEQNLPLPSTISGIGTALLRDTRFYPEARGRVPSATNERARPFLPGVHQELRTKLNRVHSATALDQRGAYHRIVQEIALPDSTTLGARGYFGDPENAPVWLRPNDPGFEDVLASPGLVCVQVNSRLTHKREFRIPAVNFIGHRRIYAWTNEIAFMRERGTEITAIYAAWTADGTDTGLPRYGAYAQEQIEAASPYRKQWLKPALHTAYGLLGAKPRTLLIGRRIGLGVETEWTLGLRRFPVKETTVNHKPPLANVTQLGMVQAEVRKRTLEMANSLNEAGSEVTHVHADGLHVVGDIPLVPSAWRIEPRTNLSYIDAVSWVSDQGDILPGRDVRMRLELRRHLAKLTPIARAPAKQR